MLPKEAFAGPINLKDNLRQKISGLLLRNRVRITAGMFVLLLLEDVLERVEPNSLANLGNAEVLFGLIFVFAGLGLRSWAAGTLHKRTALTTSGPYGLIRHPLYVGSYLMMLGFCLLIDDTENIWFVLGPILALYVYRALHEEMILAAAFPNQWSHYAQKVSRFLPRRWPMELFATWNVHQWRKNREYQAVGATLVGLIALQVWNMIV